jgi:hypothetical protein
MKHRLAQLQKSVKDRHFKQWKAFLEDKDKIYKWGFPKTLHKKLDDPWFQAMLMEDLKAFADIRIRGAILVMHSKHCYSILEVCVCFSGNVPAMIF